MKLLPGESVLLESDGKVLTLTNLRVRYRAEVLGSANIISIFLTEMASCGLVYKSYPLLLLFAALAGLGLFIGPSDAQGGLLVLAVIFVGLYFATRWHVLAVASAGHTINVPIRGMTTDSALAFIEEAEAAKNRLAAVSLAPTDGYARPAEPRPVAR